MEIEFENGSKIVVQKTNRKARGVSMSEPEIVDDLVTKCLNKFFNAGYMVQIYPLPNGYAVMAMKIGKQGAHYVSSHLEDALVMLLGHMQNQDENLRGMVSELPKSN